MRSVTETEMVKRKDVFLTNPWELNPIWNVLTPAEKEEVVANMEICHYRKNDIIHREGKTPTHMMMVVAGKIKIFKDGIGMRQQIIRLLKPYDLFSYRGVAAGGTYNSTAVAIEQCTVYQLRKEIFLKLLQQNNEFCFLVLRNMAGALGAQEAQTVSLTQKHIRSRLAEALLKLKQDYGTDADKVTIAMYMSRDDLAAMSNMTTSNAIRTLSQFAHEGIVSVDGRKIKILDEEALKRLDRLG